jgi:hypothetical protein
MSKYRYFGKHHSVLVTWSQRRCSICNRFLTKKQHRYCKKCGKERIKIVTLSRDEMRYYSIETIRRLIDDISIPTFILDGIGGYPN